MPEISLVIPIYNVEKYLKRCIESIAKQSFTNFEAIFVNDGSTDDSAHICAELIKPYTNMRMVNKVNGGLSSARLCGFKESIGKYVAFVDSDDYLHPDYLKTLYTSITENNADVSMCSYYTDNGTSQEMQILSICPKDGKTVINPEEVLSRYVLPQLPSVDKHDSFLPSFMWLRLFRKSILNELMFISERLVFQEDLVLSLILLPHSPKIAVTNKALYYYCINPGSLTLKYRDNFWDMMMTLYHYINKYLVFDSEDSTIQNRLDGFLFNAIFSNLRNASLHSFSIYKKAIKDTREIIGTTHLFRKKYPALPLRYSALKIVFSLSIPYILYLFYYIKN